MAVWWKISLQVLCAFYLCLCLFENVEIEARRGGGGRFGGRYSSRYGTRYSTRNRVRYGGSGSSTRVRVRVRNGYGYGTSRWSWHAAATAGALYGYHSYSLRRSYYRYPDREPRICINEYDYRMDNGTYFSLFICPMQGDSDSHTYCCGPEDRQSCCGFWDGSGRVAGVVFGILFAGGFTALIIYCCCCKNGGIKQRSIRRAEKKSTTIVTYSGVSTAPPTTAPPTAASYPLNPTGGSTMNTPYPPAPQPVPYTGPNASYPQQGQPPYPPTDPSYPSTTPAYPPGQDAYPPGPEGYPPQPGYPPYNAAPPYPVETKDGMPPYGVSPPAAPYPAGPPGGAPYPTGGPQAPYPSGGPQAPYPTDAGYPSAPPPPY